MELVVSLQSKKFRDVKLIRDAENFPVIGFSGFYQFSTQKKLNYYVDIRRSDLISTYLWIMI